MKYELTDMTKTIDGITLYRIKALKNFANVSKGELGGYVQSKENLSDRGNARVSSSANIHSRNMIFIASNVGTENGTLTVFNGKDGLLATRGCFSGTVEEFLAKSKKVHDDKTHREYQLLIEVAKSRILV